MRRVPRDSRAGAGQSAAEPAPGRAARERSRRPSRAPTPRPPRGASPGASPPPVRSPATRPRRPPPGRTNPRDRSPARSPPRRASCTRDAGAARRLPVNHPDDLAAEEEDDRADDHPQRVSHAVPVIRRDQRAGHEKRGGGVRETKRPRQGFGRLREQVRQRGEQVAPRPRRGLSSGGGAPHHRPPPSPPRPPARPCPPPPGAPPR